MSTTPMAQQKEGSAVLNIARLTFMEAGKKKIFFVTIILTLAFLLLYGLGLHFTDKEMAEINAVLGAQLAVQQIVGNQLLGLGLYLSSFMLSLLALMVSVGSIASEVESGLLHAIVSKPIRRRDIVLGKFLGYGLMLTAYSLVLFIMLLLLNWIFNDIALTLLTPANFFYGVFIFVLQPLVLLGLALVFSTSFRTMAAGIITFAFYGLSIVGGFMEQIGALINKTALINTGIVTSLVMPSDALFRKLISVLTNSEANPLSSLTGPMGVGIPPSNAMIVYACLYLVACVGLAVSKFAKKDL
ncbi:ABC transporter permease subunit [Peptococcaceae bacterium 1198_IL3148]